MAKSSKKQSVDRTRLTWVLGVLVASMTIGTVFLGVLEPNRALSAEAKLLSATYNTVRGSRIAQTQTPIDGRRWDAVIIHQVGSDLRLSCLAGDKNRTPPAAHFVIAPDATTLVTAQWENQKDAPGYRGKIQIGIQRAPGQQYATLEQAEALVTLVRDLQVRCDIPVHKVYVHSQLSARACSPDPLARFYWREALLP